MNSNNELYKLIPKIDLCLEDEKIISLINRYGRFVVCEVLRNEIEKIRELIGNNSDEELVRKSIDDLIDNVENNVIDIYKGKMKKVINATGVILHTNLGRAVLSEKQFEHARDILTNYNNLEYNLETGARGERYSHFKELVSMLTGAQDCMAVNNNAAAVMLVLSSLAKDKEVIVSRGELVEIGGKFRIPDVCKLSGAKLVEVGTTNKTRVSDYEEMINENTAAILKVHTSNYEIKGFHEDVDITELSNLSHQYNIPIIEDLGSGALVNFEELGLVNEPTVTQSIQNDVDIVCFSGDKLLFGPQAGFIVGKSDLISKCKKNQLTRALRIDKCTVALIEAVLIDYLDKDKAYENIPLLNLIRESVDNRKLRAEKLCEMIKQYNLDADIYVEKSTAKMGGGTMPLVEIDSFSICIKPNSKKVTEVESEFRNLEVPIIATISQDTIQLNIACIFEKDYEIICKSLTKIL